MSLFKLKLQSYRAFRDESIVNVRPLTLLYGYNQAGKSTLVRLLALLADSLQPGGGPLDLESPSLRGATFKELGWMGRAGLSMTPEVQLICDTATPEPRLRVQFADEKGLIVNRLDLVEGEKGDKFRVSLDADTQRVGRQVAGTYAGRYKGADWRGVLTFDSLFPAGLPEQAETIAKKVKVALGPLQRLQWLRANRLVDGIGGERPIRCCRSDGSDLASVIRGKFERQILDSVVEWFSEQDGIGNEVTIQSNASGQPQLFIGAPGKERLPINLAGEGVRSLLPILISACWAESDDANRPSMLAIEEPEAHLHPTLQVALFDRILASVKAGVPIVLETHSVYILRAMQVAVLEGRISPDDVGLHWISQDKDGAASVANVEVKNDAELSGWRPFIFEKEQELAHKIIDLRWKQGDAA